MSNIFIAKLKKHVMAINVKSLNVNSKLNTFLCNE